MAHWRRNVVGVMVCVAGAVAIGCTAPPAPQDLPNRKQILADAKAAQYSLLRDGMQSLHCTATVDWPTLVDWRGPQDASEKSILAALEKSHYEVFIDNEGTPKVSIVQGATASDPGNADDVRKELEIIRRTLQGLLNAWTGYMAATVLPGDDVDVHMVETGGNYYLKYVVGDMAASIDMNSNYELLRVWEKDKQATTDVRPTFDRTLKGFVVNGYQFSGTDFEKNRSTDAKLVIQYTTVDGLLVPQTLTETVPGDRGTGTVRISFADYTVTRRSDAASPPGGAPNK